MLLPKKLQNEIIGLCELRVTAKNRKYQEFKQKQLLSNQFTGVHPENRFIFEALLKKEEEEWRKDLNCVLLLNMPESTSSSYKTQILHDRELAEETIGQVTNIENIIKLSRIGIRLSWDQPRPIKVVLNSPHTAQEVLRKKEHIVHSTLIVTAVENTLSQRKYIEDLNKQLEKRTANGEIDLHIRYVDRVPQIVGIKVDIKKQKPNKPKKYKSKDKSQLRSEINKEVLSYGDWISD